MPVVSIEVFDRGFLLVRGQKVMPAADLVEVYGLKTNQLNQLLESHAIRDATL